jgi:2-desacetyl-2-hydroxyethyl bacteriochlorophyllide A dehydrogenase
MKAAIVRKTGEILVEDLPIPVPGPEEALVKVIYGGICGTDVHVMMGHHPTARFPVVLGHEFVGELVEINTIKDIDIKAGDLVLVQPYVSCGVCDSCIQGRDNVCSKLAILEVHEFGCFAEYVKVPAHKVYKLPANMDLKLAALVEPLAVAVHDVRKSNLQVGQTAFIIGGGPIGALIAIVARLNGVTNIAVSEVNEYRIKFVQDLGFTVINPLETDVLQEVQKITGGKGFDVVYEVSGTKQGAELMTKVVKIGGTVVIVGVPTGIYPVDTGSILAKEIQMTGVRIHSQINFAAAINIMKTGAINDQLVKFIDSEFTLDEIKEAMEFSMKDQKHFKTLIKIH